MFKRIVSLNLLVLAAAIAVISAPAAFGVADSTTLSQTINAGSLTADIVNANVTMAALTYKHSGQHNDGNAVGNVGVVDARGTGVGWTADWTGANWVSGANTMAYNGDGSTTGQLCVDNPVSSDVTVNAGTNDKATWTYGTDTCFSSGTSTVNFITTGSNKGDGDYTVGNTKVGQYIPGQQKTGTYATTLTLTVS